MDYHKNARLTVQSREQMAKVVLEEGLKLKQAAACFRVSARTAAKWVARYRELGRAGLVDHSSRPHRLRRPTKPEQAALVEQLRRQRWTGLRIAQQTGLSRATVSRILRRLKLSRISDLEPRRPANRYEHERPGDLLHLDIKKLGRIGRPGHRVTGDLTQRARGVGWEFVHVAIDDHSRIGFSAILPNERAASVCRFLLQALRFYRSLGIRIHRILTDNGPAYHSRALHRLCRRLGIRHRYTKPYTPQTNGKAERFIQTALREWAYACTYQHSAERASKLHPWLHEYNWHRPHASLNQNTPISRAGFDRNNLLTMHN
jgi:transposase InsO family protein